MHDNRVQRDFTAIRPDLVWLTDITEHPTLEGKLYCCAIRDVFSNRIVGCALADRMTADLAVAALRSAIARRRPKGTVVVHSDHGSQFRSRAFRRVLRIAGLTGSMDRVASAGDNAAMESFFSTLQTNVLDRRRAALARPRVIAALRRLPSGPNGQTPARSCRSTSGCCGR